VVYDNRDELAPKSKAAKDTRNWCRGRPGVLHDWVILMKNPKWRRFSYRILVCRKCGKKAYRDASKIERTSSSMRPDESGGAAIRSATCAEFEKRGI